MFGAVQPVYPQEPVTSCCNLLPFEPKAAELRIHRPMRSPRSPYSRGAGGKVPRRFINDEAAALGQWHRPYFGGCEFKSAFYEKVFEVLLRLKANYLWPAVWDHAFAEDDPKNHARSLGGRAEDRGRRRAVA